MEMLGTAGNRPGVHRHRQEMEKQHFEGIAGRWSSTRAVLCSCACNELCTGSAAAPAGVGGSGDNPWRACMAFCSKDPRKRKKQRATRFHKRSGCPFTQQETFVRPRPPKLWLPSSHEAL